VIKQSIRPTNQSSNPTYQPARPSNAQLAPPEAASDDIELCSTVLSLRCPLSGRRARRPARFASTPQQPLEAFDLDVFLEVTRRSRKWQVGAGFRCVSSGRGPAGL
jgi:hypothetical protein